MKRQAIIISVAVFLLLIGSTVFAHKFRTRCKGQSVKTRAAYASCAYMDCVSERRYFNIDSIIYIKNRSTRPIKLLKVAFVGEKTGVIKEFVNEADTVEVAPLSLRCFTVNNETIPAEEYKRPQFQSSTGHKAEGVSFHVEWEADSRVAPPIITSELIKPLLPLFYEPILPDGGSCNCEVIDQW